VAVLIEELLQVWREAERILEQLPDTTPERTILQVEVGQLRSMHRRLTDRRIEPTAHMVAASHDTIESARRTIERAKERLERSPASD